MIEFKQLDIKPEGSWLKRLISSQHAKRTVLFMLIGAIGGFLFFYFSEGQHMAKLTTTDIFKSIGVGAFFGWFITNSPCARGRC